MMWMAPRSSGIMSGVTGLVITGRHGRIQSLDTAPYITGDDRLLFDALWIYIKIVKFEVSFTLSCRIVYFVRIRTIKMKQPTLQKQWRRLGVPSSKTTRSSHFLHLWM
jgi:hypothetical protein